jgi:hypothetical protein
MLVLGRTLFLELERKRSPQVSGPVLRRRDG